MSWHEVTQLHFLSTDTSAAASVTGAQGDLHDQCKCCTQGTVFNDSYNNPFVNGKSGTTLSPMTTLLPITGL